MLNWMTSAKKRMSKSKKAKENARRAQFAKLSSQSSSSVSMMMARHPPGLSPSARPTKGDSSLLRKNLTSDEILLSNLGKRERSGSSIIISARDMDTPKVSDPLSELILSPPSSPHPSLGDKDHADIHVGQYMDSVMATPAASDLFGGEVTITFINDGVKQVKDTDDS